MYSIAADGAGGKVTFQDDIWDFLVFQWNVRNCLKKQRRLDQEESLKTKNSWHLVGYKTRSPKFMINVQCCKYYLAWLEHKKIRDSPIQEEKKS